MAESMGKDEDFKPGHRNRIIDDRGRSVLMLEVADLPQGSSKDLLAAVRSANRHRFKHIGVILLIVIAGAVALQLLISWTSGTGYGKGLLNFARPGVYFNLAILGAGLYGVEKVRNRARTGLAECIRATICPSCGYSLANLVAAADGCTICPECGAAWKLSVPMSQPDARDS